MNEIVKVCCVFLGLFLQTVRWTRLQFPGWLVAAPVSEALQQAVATLRLSQPVECATTAWLK